MTIKNQVAVKSNTDIATDVRPEWMKTDGNRGSEEVSNDDVTLPRLQIVQDLSPQHKKTKPEYIEGAEVGDFFNTVSQELYKESTLIVPVYFKLEYIIWKDQKAGGGFFGSFDTELAAKKALPEVIAEDGGKNSDYEVVDTNVHFVLLVTGDADAPDIEQAVISMSKSQNKVSRNLNSMVRMAGGDRFSKVYRLSSCDDKNSAGQEYKNWRVKPVGWVSEAVYKSAEETYNAIIAGERKVDYSAQKSEEEAVVKRDTAPTEDFDDEFGV